MLIALSKMYRFAELWWDWVPSEGASGGLISIWDDKLYKAEGAIKPQRILAIKMRGIGDGFEWASECAWFERRRGKNSILGLSQT